MKERVLALLELWRVPAVRISRTDSPWYVAQRTRTRIGSAGTACSASPRPLISFGFFSRERHWFQVQNNNWFQYWFQFLRVVGDSRG